MQNVAGALREVTIAVGNFLFCSFLFEMTSLELFISPENLHKHELFLPTYQPTKIMLLGITHIPAGCHPNFSTQQSSHEGSRGMSIN